LITPFLRLWPLALLTLPFAAVFCILLISLSEAIEASGTLHNWQWGNTDTLFMLNAGLLGWCGVAAAERNRSTIGFMILLYAIPCCVAAIAIGYGVASLILDGLSVGMWRTLYGSLGVAVVMSLIRTYLADLM